MQLEEDFVKANPDWVKELEIMVTSKVKAEIQALSSFGFQYLSHQYLPLKLQVREGAGGMQCTLEGGACLCRGGGCLWRPTALCSASRCAVSIIALRSLGVGSLTRRALLEQAWQSGSSGGHLWVGVSPSDGVLAPAVPAVQEGDWI